MSNPTPVRRPRRWRWKALGVALVLAVGLVAALPWLIAGPFRSRVLAGLNRGLAPGRIEFEGLHLSWFGPTRLERVVILDPKGTAVIKANSLILTRTLGQLILRDRSPVILSFEGAALDIARSEDGTLDVVDAIRTVAASPDPTQDVTIRVVDGSIRYRDPVLAEPAVADSVDLTIRVPYAPSPVTWAVTFGRGDASLESHGDFDAWLSKGGPPRAPELQIAVIGKRWPLVARSAGVDASCRLDGALDFNRKRGRWIFSGDARLDGLNARGKPLAGDSLAFDRSEAGWDLAQGEDGWKIRRLSATCPLGHLKAEGDLGGPGGSGKQRIEGVLDLAEIARQLPHALHLRDGLVVDRGSARIAVDLESGPGRSTYDVEAKVVDLSARDHGRELSIQEPATFAARFLQAGDDSRVERLSVHTSFLDASAQGRLEDGVALRASFDLDGLRKHLGRWVDLAGVELAGRGELRGTYQFRPSGSPVASTREWFASRVAEGSAVVIDPLPLYTHDLKATLKDLRIEGVGPWSIRRDSTTLDFSASGDAGPSGMPLGWKWLALDVASGQALGRVALHSRGGPIRLDASLKTSVRLGDRDRPASLKVAGEWSGDRRTLAMSSILASLDAPEGRPERSRLALAARGRLDTSTGELTLDPTPPASKEFLAVDADGLRASGLGRGLEALRLDGGLSGDLAGLDSLIAEATGRPPLGLSGRWSVVGNARGDADGVALAGKVGLDDPLARSGKPSRPTGLAVRAHYAPRSDRLDLTEFTVSTRYGTLDASGKLEAATGDAVVDLKGMVAPDFEAINALLAARVEPGARVDGRPRAFRAAGPLGGPNGWKGLDAEVGFDLAGADIYGMKFGPSPVVLRANRGRLAFDPISTTLNEGHVRLEAEVDLDAPGGPVLRLAKNSAIREARINDEVSKRVLAYVAPILDQATRASGLVSVDLDHAEFPIGSGRGRQAKVEGAVVFQDVEFAPGPLAAEILGVIGRRDFTLKLDQPVTLTIADGRVNQRGMSIPVGGLTRIDLSGYVDFDRNIALNASLPVTPAMLGNNPLLSDIVAGTRVRLPITGTLDRPEIDRDAFAANLQEMGKSLLTRGATRGAMELFMRLARPRDPDAPPPPPRPSAEEKKAIRQEKKAIRRGEVPPPVETPRR